MTECHFCHKKIETIPYKCRWCEQTFCSKHRLPENHNCSKIKTDSIFSKGLPSSRLKIPVSKNLQMLLLLSIGLILIAIFLYFFILIPIVSQNFAIAINPNNQGLKVVNEVKKEYFAPDGTKAIVVGESGVFDDQGIAEDGRKVLLVTLKSVQKVPGEAITYSRKKTFSNPFVDEVAEPFDDYWERNYYFFILKFDIKNIGESQIRWHQFSMTRGYLIDSSGREYPSNIFYDIDDLEPGSVLSVECSTASIPNTVVTNDVFFKWRIYHGSGRQTDTMNIIWHIFP